MAYPGVDWQNKPSTASPINRTNLEIMDNGIVANDFANNKNKTENVSTGIKLLENKYVNNSGGVTTGTNRFCSDFIPCPPNVEITYIGENNHANVCGLSFYNKDFTFISGSSNTGTAKGTPTTVTSPANTAYCRLSTDKEVIQSDSGSYVKMSSNHDYPLIWISRRIDDCALKAELAPVVFEAGVNIISSALFSKSDLSTGYYYALNNNTNPVQNSDSVYTPNAIDVSSYVGKKMAVIFDNIDAGARTFGFLNAQNQVVKYYSYHSEHQEKNGFYIYYVDIVGPKFLFSWTKNASYIQTYIYENNAATKTELGATNEEVTKIERYVGLISSSYDISGEDAEITIQQNDPARAITKIYDASLVLSIGVSQPPTGFGFSIYYDNNNNGWNYNAVTRNKPDNTYNTWKVVFRKSDNSNISSADLETIKSGFTITVTTSVIDTGGGAKTCYVSTNGSDSNAGTEIAPFATVNKALSAGASVVCISAGTYKQTINIANASVSTVEFRNITKDGKVIFQNPDSVIAESESSVSGYSNVKSATTSKTFSDSLKWIWQDGVKDASTLISDTDRLPLQRGQEYRMFDTKIVRCTADNLSDALTEIENADVYKWYYDSENTRLYFSRPETVSASKPICAGFGGNLFSGGARTKSIKAYGIESKYMAFNITNMSGVELHDCKAANTFNGGAFIYDSCISVLFERCEACGCQSGSVGDGFNGHSVKTGDPFAKQTTVTMIDCWSHDNNDDGYSDHERSEITIIGGLFENNGKGGVVPSYGSHANCYNVVSRYNYNGFYYVGDVASDEGGKYGQMLCIGCYAKGNTNTAGFRVAGNGNRAILIDCRSVNNVDGYYCGSTSYMQLIDCRGKGNTNNVVDTANHITVNNTDLIGE